MAHLLRGEQLKLQAPALNGAEPLPHMLNPYAIRLAL